MMLNVYEADLSTLNTPKEDNWYVFGLEVFRVQALDD